MTGVQTCALPICWSISDSRKAWRSGLSAQFALEMVERMEEEGDILVIRPQKPVVVDRIERDIQKLTDLYEEGYECAKRQLETL